MRVLHFINSLGGGGSERSLAEMLPRFTEAGIENAVVCLTQAREGVHEDVERAGIPVQVIGARRLSVVPRLRPILARWRPDILHTTIYEADVLGRVAAVGLPCTVMTSLVATTYDGVRVADSQISPTKLAAAKAVDGVTARHLTDHFHAVSEAVKDSAVRHLRIPPERVTVVERGRDLTRLGEPSRRRRASVRAALGLPQDAEVVVNVGRQEPQKDQATLLQAVAELARARPGILLLQVGKEGKATPVLRRFVEEHGLTERVRFLGHRDDIGDLLAASDVFALSSLYEGLPGTALEAMALRVPIAVTDLPGLAGVLEDARSAAVVPFRDPPALARAIGHLLDHPEKAAAMAERARQVFFERFTLERSVDRMVALYHQVARGERPAPGGGASHA
jgi:glycosyltransferase involved in cell wall biosynthesis